MAIISGIDMMIWGLVIVLFPLLMAFAAASDLVSMTISNKVSIGLVLAFLVAALAIGMAPATIGLHLLVGIAVLALTFACFAFGWMGGGDAKLMAATALWFGPTADLLSYFLIGSIYGGVLTLGLLSVRGMMAPVTGIDFVDRLLHPKTGIPYGIALGIAGLTVFADSQWMDLAIAGLR